MRADFYKCLCGVNISLGMFFLCLAAASHSAGAAAGKCLLWLFLGVFDTFCGIRQLVEIVEDSNGKK